MRGGAGRCEEVRGGAGAAVHGATSSSCTAAIARRSCSLAYSSRVGAKGTALCSIVTERAERLASDVFSCAFEQVLRSLAVF